MAGNPLSLSYDNPKVKTDRSITQALMGYGTSKRGSIFCKDLLFSLLPGWPWCPMNTGGSFVGDKMTSETQAVCSFNLALLWRATYFKKQICLQSNCHMLYMRCEVSTTATVNVTILWMSPYITWQKYAHLWKERTVSIFAFLGNVRKFLSHHATSQSTVRNSTSAVHSDKERPLCVKTHNSTFVITLRDEEQEVRQSLWWYRDSNPDT
jgi:hypothetical protein